MSGLVFYQVVGAQTRPKSEGQLFSGFRPLVSPKVEDRAKLDNERTKAVIMVRRMNSRGWRGAVLAVSLLLLSPTVALAIPNYAAEYLMIGTGPKSTAIGAKASNWELGANSASSPWFSTASLPGNALPVATGIGGNGDIAITNSNGAFDLSNMEVWGDTGVDCAGSLNQCNENRSNTDYNGSSMTNSNGSQGGVDLSGLNSQLAALAVDIPALPSDLNLSFNDGKWDSNLTINLGVGVTVIDIDTNDNDLLLENDNLLFDGPEGAFAIVRVPDEANFLVSQANIIVGNGGIGLNNVLFFSDKPDNNQHFNFNDTIINGVAFWDLSSQGEISLNNAQGCTQLVGSKINTNDIRLNSCTTAVPEPNTALFVGLGLVGLASMRRVFSNI